MKKDNAIHSPGAFLTFVDEIIRVDKNRCRSHRWNIVFLIVLEGVSFWPIFKPEELARHNV